MAANRSQLKALIYKEYVTHKKNLLTVIFIQLAIPMTLCYLLLVYVPSRAESAFEIAEHKQTTSKTSEFNPNRLHLCNLMFNSTVYFYPRTNETIDLMKNAKKKCIFFKAYPIDSNEGLDKVMANLSTNYREQYENPLGAVVFNKLSTHYIDYELRPVNFPILSLYKKQVERSFLIYPNPYVISNFVSMQVFINEAFLETVKKTKTVNNKKTSNTSNMSDKEIDKEVEFFAVSQMTDIDIFKEMPIMKAILIYYSVFVSTVLPLIVFLKRVLDEKQSQMKKLLKIMSMNELQYWVAKCLFVVIIFLFLDVFIIFLVKLNTEDRLDISLLFIILLIYFLSSMFLAMALSSFFNAAIFGIAAFLALNLLSSYPLWFFLSSPGDATWNMFQGAIKLSEEVFIVLFVIIPPNYSLIASLMLLMEGNNYAYSSKYVSSYASYIPKWSNLFVVTPRYKLLSLGVVMIASLTSTLLWFLVHLLLTDLSSSDSEISQELEAMKCLTQDSADESDDRKLKEYFETEPHHLKAGIVIKNLTKKFSETVIAVKDLSFNLYFGQITVLLGHNGAGKTTLMNMIAGLTQPSSGSIQVNGFDVTNDRKKAKGMVGLCPQKEILLENFTVEEHLYIFAILKGFPLKHIKNEIARVLQILKLTDKEKLNAASLSGGMRRKLQFGISIVGGCNILILDEPSSGLDIESRRRIWDLLRSLRKTFLIFMTTHHMEEADCLADRIIIMADGKIKCSGSTPFLKRIFDVGYNLRILTESSEKWLIRNFVVKNCYKAKFVKETSNEIIFSVPPVNTKELQIFCETLEEHTKSLGIRSFGLTTTSLDDVFLNSYQLFKKCKSLFITYNARSKAFEKTQQVSTSEMFSALLLKRFQADLKRWKIFVSFICLNITFTVIAFYMIYSSIQVKANMIQWMRNLNYTEFEYKQINGFCSSNTTHFCDLFQKTATNFGIELTEIQSDPRKYMNKLISSRYEFYREKYVLGIEEKQSRITIWYLNQAIHSLPVGVNIAFNFIIKQLTNNSDANITLSIRTQSSYSASKYRLKLLKRNIYIIPYALVYSLLFACCFPTILLTSERSTKAKLLQYISGVTPFAYWATNILYDILYSMLVFSPLWVIIFSFSKNIVFFNTVTGMAVFLSFIGFMLSSASLNFLMSQITRKPSTAFVVIFLFNAIPATVFNEFFLHRKEYKGLDEEVSLVVEAMIHLFEFGSSMSYFWLFVEVVVNSMLATNSIHLCSALTEEDKLYIGIDPSLTDCDATCNDCYNENYNPFRYEKPGVLFEIVWIYVIFIGSAIISFMIEFRWFEHEFFAESHNSSEIDYDVKMENDKVNELAKRQYSERRQHHFLCHQLSKVFTGVISLKELSFSVLLSPRKLITHFVAVNNLSFSVQKNEFFGFLGVNGAGKTTTFRMLTGDLIATAGNAYLSSYSLRNNFRKYQHEIGYCPQENVLLDCLTGRQIFEFLAKIRGISKDRIAEAVNELLHIVGLESYSETTTSVYSGGNLRKLALGIALIGSPSILMLDEPTSGVDPFSRRKLWKAIEIYRSVNSGSVILSSHSFDECEALCNRIAILAKGTLQCIGPIQQLKSKFCPGHTITIKLNRYMNNLKQIDESIKNSFSNAIVTDEHDPLIVYQLLDAQISISTIFQIMEGMKQRLQFEEYQVSQTSLEQLFLAFSTESNKI